MRALVPLCAALALAAPAAAQDQASSGAALMPEVFALLDEGKMMPALVVLEQVAADPAMLNTAAQFWAFSGDVRRADEWFAQSWPARAVPEPDLSDVPVGPAVETILHAAEGKRVVILNEAHHAPRHRAFSHQVMLALREAGFTHFAAETFTIDPEATLLDLDAPTLQTGFYTQDPAFGDLVRQAAAAGYDLVIYEQSPDQWAPEGAYGELSVAFREQAQAENIKAVLDANPDARIFVHAGLGHVAEAPMGNAQLAWMAARLTRMLDEDILTIDQTEGTPSANPDRDSSLYRAFIAAYGDPQAPVAVANDPEAPLGDYRVDLSIIHPVQTFVSGRPDWLSMDGYRQPHEVTFDSMSERTLIRAFVAGEPENAIPMDQIIAPAGATSVTLMLPRGAYRLVRQTEAGEDLPLGDLSL